MQLGVAKPHQAIDRGVLCSLYFYLLDLLSYSYLKALHLCGSSAWIFSAPSAFKSLSTLHFPKRTSSFHNLSFDHPEAYTHLVFFCKSFHHHGISVVKKFSGASVF